MLCYFNLLEDKLTSYANITEMFENIPVMYQRNIIPHSTQNTNLALFLQTIEHQEKSKAGLIRFFTDLVSHPKFMLGEGTPSYNSLPTHRIDWKSALDESYNKKFIEKITANDYILLRSIYIQEDKNSKNAKKGKTQTLFMYLNATLCSSKNEDAVATFNRVAHLNFIDSLILNTHVC